LRVLKCLFLCGLELVNPKILVEVLIGLKMPLFYVFSLVKE
jgi:hypothetical protein